MLVKIASERREEEAEEEVDFTSDPLSLSLLISSFVFLFFLSFHFFFLFCHDLFYFKLYKKGNLGPPSQTTKVTNCRFIIY